MKTIRVKPVGNLRIRRPDKPAEMLPADGADVPMTQYWLRRLREGSVEKIEDAQDKPGPSKKEAAKKGENKS